MIHRGFASYLPFEHQGIIIHDEFVFWNGEYIISYYIELKQVIGGGLRLSLQARDHRIKIMITKVMVYLCELPLNPRNQVNSTDRQWQLVALHIVHLFAFAH